jgi:hypothetical protein
MNFIFKVFATVLVGAAILGGIAFGVALPLNLVM